MPSSRLAGLILSAVAICTVVSGCGQKGPLTLPDEAEASSLPANGNGETDDPTSEEVEDNDG